MSLSRDRLVPAPRDLVLFDPQPDLLYGLDAAAHLAGLSRRALLILCRAGLVRPVLLPPYDTMCFTEEAIHAVRQIVRLRSEPADDLARLKTLFDLLEEVERLRAEVRFLRSR